MKPILSEEFRRMQKLAGIITENQYKREIEEAEMGDVTPEKAAQIVTQNIDNLKLDSKLDAIANKIAINPEASKELNKIMSKFNISLNEEGNNPINPQDVYKISLAFAKQANTLEEGFDYGGAFWTGIVGGGIIAKYLASAGDIITPHMEMLGHSPSHIGATVAGSIAGAILLLLAKRVYDKLKNK